MGMTLDEAILHAEEVAEDKEIDIENQDPLFPNNIEECKKCAEEHRQLAEWLKDYKRLKEQEPCEDAISRQAVLEIIRFEYEWLLDAKSHNADTEIAFSGMISKVNDLQPVKPKERTVEWKQDGEGITAEEAKRLGKRICECFEKGLRKGLKK